jgi:hypothetical protein
MKLILYPRFASTYVHYDRVLFKDGERVASQRSRSDFDGAPYPSFRADKAVGYISSPDKKVYRQLYAAFDKEIEPSDFEEPFSFYNQSLGEITECVVCNPPYICPSTGLVWQYAGHKEVKYSKRPWLFRRIPKKTKNKKGIHIAGDGPLYDLMKVKPKTAFVSGEISELWGREDSRKFMDSDNFISKLSIVKSAARKLKKLKPLKESTILFFKTLGAIAHLNKTKTK